MAKAAARRPTTERGATRRPKNESLLADSHRGERRRGTGKAMGAWLAANPAALELVDDWLFMRAEGTCWKTTHWLVKELQRSHGLSPMLATPGALQSWLKAHRAEQFEAAR